MFHYRDNIVIVIIGIGYWDNGYSYYRTGLVDAIKKMENSVTFMVLGDMSFGLTKGLVDVVVH